MKKILSKLLLFLSMALILSGCTKAVQKAEKEVVFSKPQYNWGEVSGKTITVWGGEDDLKRSYLKKAFARYQEITGNTLKIRTLSNDEFAEDVPKAFASPDAEKPDILLSYGGTNLDNLKPDDNFYDFTKAQWVEDLTDSAINQTIYNGKVIGLPHGDVSISGTLYNKEIFKKYGLEVPENQEAFMAVCEELLKNGVTPVYLPYEGATMLLYQFPMDSFLQDAETLERLNNGTLSYSQIPEMKKIIQWYRTMASKGYFGKNYTDNNWDGMSGALESGKYAMMLTSIIYSHGD
ncbi:MAG: ABC transporter substrate-binding protein [Eubacterium sp.]